MDPSDPTITCSACRTENPATAAFCSRCGGALTTPTTSAAPAASPSGWALATAGMGAPAPVITPGGFVQLDKDAYAGWWARLWAAMLDGLLFLLTYGVLVGIAAGIWFLLDADGAEEAFRSLDQEQSEDSIGAFFGIAIVGYFPAYVLWEVLWVSGAKMGKPGQRALGFRVVAVDGLERCSKGRATGRAFIKVVLNAVMNGLAAVVSAFTIGITDKRQALHDMIASTVCVRTSELEKRGLLGGEGVAAGAGYDPSAHGRGVGMPLPAPTVPAWDADTSSGGGTTPPSSSSGPFV